MYYRAVAQNKWLTVISDENYSGDSITGDLRTCGNTLSVWKLDESDKTLIDYYCVITALNRTKIAKVDYVIFDEKDFEKIGIKLNQVDGICESFTDDNIKKNHFDLIEIGYKELGKIAKLVHDKIVNNQEKTITIKEIKNKIDNCPYVDKTKLPDNFFKK